MKNNKGFTLIELLAVIVIIGIVAAIAMPSIFGVTSTVQEELFEEKIELIEEAAILYGQDNKNEVVESTLNYDGDNPCISITVGSLVPDYLDSDNDSCTNGVDCVVNPNDDSVYLDTYEVIIYYKYKRIKAVVDTNNSLVCE